MVSVKAPWLKKARRSCLEFKLITMENRAQLRKSNQYPDDVPWTIISQSPDETKIRLGLKSKDEFQSWLTHYQSKCGYIYRVLRHRKSDGKYAVFKATYRCQHNTVPSHHKAKKPSTKHTNCPAKIEVTIKAVHKRSRGLDNYMPDYPAIVRIIGIHNHRSNAQEALKHKDVPEHIRSKFLELFKAGHGPAQALKLHKSDLMAEYGDEYNQFVSDRAVCPDSKWVYYVYNRDFKKFHTHPYPKDASVKELEQEIKHLQSQGIRISMKIASDESYYIAMCTPLMDRIHHLETSGHVALFDSSGNIDRYNRHVFTIMVDSCLGGLPVGALIVSNLSVESFTQVCKLYCTVMPENAFGGRGEWGPVVFLCDNIKFQEKAVKECFPNSLIALCPSIALHQGWRWLWNSKHNIESLEKREIYVYFSYLFTCPTEVEFQKYYDSLIISDVIQKYPKLVKFLCEQRLQNEIWETSWVTNSLILDNSSKSVSQISIRLIKDKILEKTKSFSMLKMVKYIESELMTFYQNRILSAVSSDSEQYFYNQYNIERQLLSEFDIVKQNDYLHEVRRLDNAEEIYQVSILCGVCDCSIGKMNGFCCHQLAVAAKEDIVDTQVLPIDNESKKHLYWLATGEQENSAVKTNASSLTKETEIMAIDEDIVQKSTSKNDDAVKMAEAYPKSEIQKIGQEFINTIMKFYEPNPKDLVLAMRKFQCNLEQKCTNTQEVISFLNSNLVGENNLVETSSHTIAVDHDYSY